jgi:nucleolar protein 53
MSRKGSRKAHRKIDVSEEVEALHRATDVDPIKSKTTAQLFFEDRADTSTKARWKAHALHADLVLDDGTGKKELVSPKKILRAYRVKKATKMTPPTKKKQQQQAKYDLWDAHRNPADVEQPVHDVSGQGWLECVRPKVPKAVKRRKMSELAPLETPTPGESYRPTPQAHEDEIVAAVVDATRESKQVAKLEEKLKRISKKKLVSRTRAVLEHALEIIDDAAASGDIEVPDLAVDDSDGEEDDSTPTKMSVAEAAALERMIKTKRARPNTKRDAKRMKKRAKREAAARHLGRIEDVAAKLEEAETTAQTRATLRRIVRHRRLMTTSQNLGETPFVPDPKPIILPSQLPTSMRAIPNVASLVRDRFQSLQKRNIVVPSARQARKSSTQSRPKIRFRETKIARGVNEAPDAAAYISAL